MELNNNYEQDSMDLENPSNPNDALFGGMSMDEPYQVRSVYTPSAVKSGPSPIITVAIIAIVLLIVGGVIFNMKKAEKEARVFDGKYVMTKMESEGLTLDMEQFEKMTGATFTGYVKIDGKKGYIEMKLNGAGYNNGASGDCDVILDGNIIKLTNGGEQIRLEHGEDDKGEYLLFDEVGGRIYFYKE